MNLQNPNQAKPLFVTVADRKLSLVNRFTRDLSSKHSQNDDELAKNATSNVLDDGKTNYRPKRQSPGRIELCQTNYQYITPQAGLNSQGNWMFIVNQVDNARQLVRTETCA